MTTSIEQIKKHAEKLLSNNDLSGIRVFFDQNDVLGAMAFIGPLVLKGTAEQIKFVFTECLPFNDDNARIIRMAFERAAEWDKITALDALCDLLAENPDVKTLTFQNMSLTREIVKNSSTNVLNYLIGRYPDYPLGNGDALLIEAISNCATNNFVGTLLEHGFAEHPLEHYHAIIEQELECASLEMMHTGYIETYRQTALTGLNQFFGHLIASRDNAREMTVSNFMMRPDKNFSAQDLDRVFYKHLNNCFWLDQLGLFSEVFNAKHFYGQDAHKDIDGVFDHLPSKLQKKYKNRYVSAKSLINLRNGQTRKHRNRPKII